MNIDELYVPVNLAKLLLKAKSFMNNPGETPGVRMVAVPESLIVELFLAAGAIYPALDSKMNENELHENENKEDYSKGVNNEWNRGVMPEVIGEVWAKSNENLIRVIFKHKNLSLKAVAERYGGRSAAANIANFLAKSDEELSKMRPATMQRIADALNCPIDWLMPLRNLDSKNQSSQANAPEQNGEP